MHGEKLRSLDRNLYCVESWHRASQESRTEVDLSGDYVRHAKIARKFCLR